MPDFGEGHLAEVALARSGRIELESVRQLGDEIDEIADMHHAARVVEIFGIDRQARMAGGAEGIEHFGEASRHARRR